MNSARIWLDARLIDRGGIGRYLRELVSAAPSGLGAGTVTALVPPGAKVPDGVIACVTPTPIPLFGWRGRFTASKWFEEPASLVHFPHFPHPRRWSARSAVFTIHDLIHLEVPGVVRNPIARRYLAGLIRSALSRAERVIVPSRATAQVLHQRFPNSRTPVQVIPMGVDVERFGSVAVSVSPVDGPYWLHVTNGKPHKNLSGLLAAFAKTRARLDGKLVIVGGLGERRAEIHRRQARELGLADRIVWAGPVTEAELVAWYRGARGVLIPSLSEGFGLPALEAMAAGVPVGASDVDGLAEVAGGAARLFDPVRIEGIAAAWDELDRDEALRRELVAAGSARCREFPWTRTVADTFALYREVIDAGSRS